MEFYNGIKHGSFQRITDLDTKYKQADRELAKKTTSLGAEVQQRAVRLRERANSLRQQTQSKLRELDELENKLPQNEAKIKELSSDIDSLLRRMIDASRIIEDRSAFYKSCSQ